MAEIKGSVVQCYLCFLCIFLVSCSSGGGRDSDITPVDPMTIEFRGHVNPIEKVALQFPDDWSRAISTDPEILVTFNDESDSSSFYLNTVMVIKIDPDEAIFDPADDGSVLVSSKQIEASGVLGIEEIADVTLNGIQLRFMSSAFIVNGNQYALIYGSEKNKFSRNIEVARYMVQSLNIGLIIMPDLDLNSDQKKPGVPGLASDGDNFLAVSCRENRDNSGNQGLIATLLSFEREVINEIQLVPDYMYCRAGRYEVIYDGQNYLVAYITQQDGKFRLFAKRISSNGVVLDDTPINVLEDPTQSAFGISMANNGQSTLIVWSTYFGSPYSAIISRDGAITSPSRISHSRGAYIGTDHDYFIPKVAYSGQNYLLVLSPYYDSLGVADPMHIDGVLLDESGKNIASQFPIRIDPGELYPRYVDVEFVSSHYIVGWIEGDEKEEAGTPNTHTLKAKRITLDGLLVDGDAESSGIELVGSVDNPYSTNDIAKKFLDMSMKNNLVYFAWTSTCCTSESGVWMVATDLDLDNISDPFAIGDIYGNASPNRATVPGQAKIAHSNDESLIIWPSRPGEIEGWYFDHLFESISE